MYYVLVIDGIVHESIPEYDNTFPGVPIADRYSPDLLSKCVQSEAAVKSGWTYDSTTGKFSEPVIDDPGVIPPAPVPAPDNPNADEMEALLDLKVRVIQLELGTTTTK